MQKDEASQAVTALWELSQLLETGLSREAVMSVLELCEMGVNPEAIIEMISDLNRMADSMKAE
eukprot:gnl/Chilomastix_caulleri/1631.p2 GENE.gnl/Chilomastix_caulleri/1631~~gnl/Chilomastix_caulleri/1631.p2  ORF type:complete len:63 (+),score=13.10 gnl/Chilomastix_caulleri/1631:37-225(+)